jgi:hypothetical protein
LIFFTGNGYKDLHRTGERFASLSAGAAPASRALPAIATATLLPSNTPGLPSTELQGRKTGNGLYSPNKELILESSGISYNK